MLSRILTALAAVVVLALAASPADAKWIRAESPRFIVYSDGDETVLRTYVADLEIFDDLLRFRHGMPTGGLPPRKLEIYLVANSPSLRRASPGMGDGIGGYYSASMGDIYAVAIRSRGENTVIQHEYVHHFMHQYFANAYPAWLVEGYAEYFDTAKVGKTQVEVGKWSEGRVLELEYLKWAPMDDLLSKRFWELPRETQGGFYGQSWLLTHYMMSDPGRYEKFLAYMKQVSGGADPAKTMYQILNTDAAGLERILRTYLKSGLKYTNYTRSGFAPPVINITTLPPSADDLLLENQRLKAAVREEEDSAKFLSLIRERAARYPGDRLATLVLARAEFRLGDFAKGKALIDAWLEANPKDPEALRLMGMAMIDQAHDDGVSGQELVDAYKGGSKFLARSFAADKTNYQTLYYFALAQQTDVGYPSENTLQVLDIAFNLAPQVDQVRLLYAQALVRKKEYDEAIVILGPVANNPHGGGAASAAQDMLRRIKANR
jgi:tetratricopeptide (TPR) repeat protein